MDAQQWVGALYLPSMCQGNIKGKEVVIRASKKPFAKEEAHLVDAAFYTELSDEATVVTKYTGGVRIPSTRERVRAPALLVVTYEEERDQEAVRPPSLSRQLSDRMMPHINSIEH